MHPKRSQKVRFYSTKTFRLACMIILTFSYFIIELVVGNITKSLALVADAFHMLSDLIALFIGLIVVRIAKRRSNINTFGWVRGEVVGANINTVFLLALCLTIVFDTIKRYIEPEPIENPTLLLIVGSIGLGINIVGLFLFQGFHGHTHGGGTQKHSHEEKAHGHSHDRKAHGHSHDGKAHGHSHDANNQSISAKKPKTNIKIKEHLNEPDNNNTTTSTYSNNIEPLEIIIGSSEFRRHSLRALDEAVVDCTSHVEDDDSSAADNTSSNVDATDSSMKNTKHKKASSMNMHGIFLHVLADALGSVVVIISSLIIKFVPRDPNNPKHWTLYIDPTLSMIIVIIITISAIPLLKESTYVLLQTVPKNIEVTSVKKQLLDQVSEIDGIHELHIWRLTSNAIIATAHVSRRSLTDYMTVANKVRNFFHGIGIHSTTIQYEQHNDESQDYLINNRKKSDESKLTTVDCLLRCPDEVCDMKTCCTKDLIRTEGISNMNNNNQAQTESTNDLEIVVEATDEQSHNHTTNDNTPIGAFNNGFIPETI